MARQLRAVAVGFPHHVVQRGNNRQAIFLDDDDRSVYLHLLKLYSTKYPTPLLAYCLMDNHVHLLAKALHEESLPQMMHSLAACYAQYFNQKYDRIGTLWQGRYYSCIVGEESYLWAAARYIEQNPRRAGMVQNDEDYPYSSAKSHVLGIPDPVLGEELFEKNQRQAYAAFLKESIPEELLKSIREATKRGNLFGSASFRDKMQRELNRTLELRPQGRQPKGLVKCT